MYSTMPTPSEEWLKWDAVSSIQTIYCLNNLNDEANQFILELGHYDHELTLIFQKVYSYRVTDENARMETYHMLESKYGNNYQAPCGFYKIKNSNYIKNLFLKKPSPDNIEHLVFFLDDHVIDVICDQEPTFEFLSSNIIV